MNQLMPLASGLSAYVVGHTRGGHGVRRDFKWYDETVACSSRTFWVKILLENGRSVSRQRGITITVLFCHTTLAVHLLLYNPDGAMISHKFRGHVEYYIFGMGKEAK